MSERLTALADELERELSDQLGDVPGTLRPELAASVYIHRPESWWLEIIAALRGIQRPDLEAAAKVCDGIAESYAADQAKAHPDDWISASLGAYECADRIRALATGPAAQGDGVERRGKERRDYNMSDCIARYPEPRKSDRRGQARAGDHTGTNSSAGPWCSGKADDRPVAMGGQHAVASAEAVREACAKACMDKAWEADRMSLHDAAACYAEAAAAIRALPLPLPPEEAK